MALAMYGHMTDQVIPQQAFPTRCNNNIIIIASSHPATQTPAFMCYNAASRMSNLHSATILVPPP
jgi:hypothetical protein